MVAVGSLTKFPQTIVSSVPGLLTSLLRRANEIIRRRLGLYVAPDAHPTWSLLSMTRRKDTLICPDGKSGGGADGSSWNKRAYSSAMSSLLHSSPTNTRWGPFSSASRV